MPEHASNLFDQQSERHAVSDWGGDELFTRMPRPRRVDDAPAPRFTPSLIVLDQPQERRVAPAGEEWSGTRDRRRPAGEAAPDLSVVTQWQPEPEQLDGWDRSGPRPMKVITGRPDAAPRTSHAAERRRPPRTPAQWVGPRPERIMAWAFALGLLLILIAISTADAATL